MNEFQTIFALFYAISWGAVCSVLPKWKPFHYAILRYRAYRQGWRRVGFAFLMFNILAWVLFVVVIYWLRGKQTGLNGSNFCRYLLIIPRAMAPAMAPFGIYRLWIATMMKCPDCFYAKKQCDLPQDFREKKHPDTENTRPDRGIVYEPTQDMLGLEGRYHHCDLLVGVLYIACSLLALIPA